MSRFVHVMACWPEGIDFLMLTIASKVGSLVIEAYTTRSLLVPSQGMGLWPRPIILAVYGRKNPVREGMRIYFMWPYAQQCMRKIYWDQSCSHPVTCMYTWLYTYFPL